MSAPLNSRTARVCTKLVARTAQMQALNGDLRHKTPCDFLNDIPCRSSSDPTAFRPPVRFLHPGVGISFRDLLDLLCGF
eukprot:1572661-Rhodomonas_salina.1